MVKDGEDFTVVDAKSGEDITRTVLTQIIFEQENKGQNLLPITFLRQLIRFYGDSIQNLIPTYLDFSIDSLVRDQDKLRRQMTNAFGPGAFGPRRLRPGRARRDQRSGSPQHRDVRAGDAHVPAVRQRRQRRGRARRRATRRNSASPKQRRHRRAPPPARRDAGAAEQAFRQEVAPTRPVRVAAPPAAAARSATTPGSPCRQSLPWIMPTPSLPSMAAVSSSSTHSATIAMSKVPASSISALTKA